MKSFLPLAILCVALGGCSSKKPDPKPDADPSSNGVEEPKDRRVIASGPVDMQAADPEGEVVWTLHGESSRVGLETEGETQIFANNVSGEIFENGKVASTFKAMEAKAARESRTLLLNDRVEIQSVAENITLRADKVNWMEDRKLFAATGNVEVDSPNWLLGKMEEVWATPDLTKIGTPNKFK